VLQGIRGMLPVKSILREYLKEDAEEEEEEEDKEEPKKEEEEKEEKEEPKKEEKEEPKKEEKEEPKEEPKKEPKKEEKEEPKEEKKPKKEEKVSQLFVDVSEENAPVEIVFTGNDTLSTEIKENKPEPIATSDAMEGEDTIQIIDEPPAALDEFEDIESNDSFLPMDFEELS